MIINITAIMIIIIILTITIITIIMIVILVSIKFTMSFVSRKGLSPSAASTGRSLKVGGSSGGGRPRLGFVFFVTGIYRGSRGLGFRGLDLGI